MAGMETNQTFNSHNSTFKILEIKAHNDNFTSQLGWTHFAAVQRLNGRKVYYTNLFIVDGEIIKSNVVL